MRMSPVPQASVGADTLVVAIGDIHGCLDRLTKLHQRIEDAAARSKATHRRIVYLGDYIDRGPDSRGVIDSLVERPPEGFEPVFLKGNHEQAMLEFLGGGPGGTWLLNGGAAACRSYGVEVEDLPRAIESENAKKLRRRLHSTVPASHRAFLAGLKLAHREGDYLFVHAGVRPGVGLEEQEPTDLLWIRGPFLESDEDFGAIVVHGHTPTKRAEIRPNRIGIDTGACYGGALTALMLEGERRSFLET